MDSEEDAEAADTGNRSHSPNFELLAPSPGFTNMLHEAL